MCVMFYCLSSKSPILIPPKCFSIAFHQIILPLIFHLIQYTHIHTLGVKQYGSSSYCMLPSSALLATLLDFVNNHFIGTSCIQLHMFYVAIDTHNTHKHTHTHTHTYTDIHSYTCSHTYTYRHTHIYTKTHTMYTHTHTYTYTHMHTHIDTHNTYTHICTHAHTHTNKHTHTYAHTHTHMDKSELGSITIIKHKF